MRVYLGADHGGMEYKQLLASYLQEKGYEVEDLGAHEVHPEDDYTDFAVNVGKAVSANPGSRGILLCRSGEGMEMAVNKIPGIRGALVWDTAVTRETRADNDANVIILPADFIQEDVVREVALVFLTTEFSNEERHIRRLQKLHRIEGVQYES